MQISDEFKIIELSHTRFRKVPKELLIVCKHPDCDYYNRTRPSQYLLMITAMTMSHHTQIAHPSKKKTTK